MITTRSVIRLYKYETTKHNSSSFFMLIVCLKSWIISNRQVIIIKLLLCYVRTIKLFLNVLWHCALYKTVYLSSLLTLQSKNYLSAFYTQVQVKYLKFNNKMAHSILILIKHNTSTYALYIFISIYMLFLTPSAIFCLNYIVLFS